MMDLEEATLEPLSNAYHWVPEDRPEAYAARLRAFLAGANT